MSYKTIKIPKLKPLKIPKASVQKVGKIKTNSKAFKPTMFKKSK